MSGPATDPAGIDYDGRRFSSAAAETADPAGGVPVGHYHQTGDLVWAEFSGGAVRAGRLVGRCATDSVIEAAYCQLLSDGAVVAGRLSSRPHVLADGRVRLEERWRRDDGSAGTSWIEELPSAGAPDILCPGPADPRV
jgi:hypothetical protein